MQLAAGTLRFMIRSVCSKSETAKNENATLACNRVHAWCMTGWCMSALPPTLWETAVATQTAVHGSVTSNYSSAPSLSRTVFLAAIMRPL